MRKVNEITSGLIFDEMKKYNLHLVLAYNRLNNRLEEKNHRINNTTYYRVKKFFNKMNK